MAEENSEAVAAADSLEGRGGGSGSLFDDATVRPPSAHVAMHATTNGETTVSATTPPFQSVGGGHVEGILSATAPSNAFEGLFGGAIDCNSAFSSGGAGSLRSVSGSGGGDSGRGSPVPMVGSLSELLHSVHGANGGGSGNGNLMLMPTPTLPSTASLASATAAASTPPTTAFVMSTSPAAAAFVMSPPATKPAMFTPTATNGFAASQPQMQQKPQLSPPSAAVSVQCGVCSGRFVNPKVLACFHSFCKACLEKYINAASSRIVCPACSAETQLCAELGVDSLLNDYAIANMQEAATLESNGNAPVCTGCKSKDSNAVAHCFDCSNYLCSNCVMAHQYMLCFDGHRVVDLAELDAHQLERPVKCLQHKRETLKLFCSTCNVPVCQTCIETEHPRTSHSCALITDCGKTQVDNLHVLLEHAQLKQRDLISDYKSLGSHAQRLLYVYTKTQQEINDTANYFCALVEEQRQTAVRDLENAYTMKQLSLSQLEKKVQTSIEKLGQTVEFTGRLLEHSCPVEVMVFKKLLETRIEAILSFHPDLHQPSEQDLEFVTNLQGARNAVSNSFGYVRQSTDLALSVGVPKPHHLLQQQQQQQQAQIGRPAPVGSGVANAPAFSTCVSPFGGSMINGMSDSNPMTANAAVQAQMQAAAASAAAAAAQSAAGMGGGSVASSSNLTGATKAFGGSSQSLDPTSTFSGGGSDVGSISAGYERWSNASDMYQGSLVGDAGYYGQTLSPEQQMIELTTKMMITPGFPPKSQIKRQKMIYHCKFGEFGVMEGQFTEPSGVAVTATGDIVVADTNNHRVQVFDKEGRFKFHFGECGKRDGQLLYPNRVGVNRSTGEIIVTERSPTHQIQIFSQYGQFVRKFGANVLQHPRGVAVDYKGRIIIVECKVMRVIIFDMYGTVLQKFGCSKYLEFPNGVCASDKQEIYISDNRAHAIKVFNYEGLFVRQIGGEGITNYPIGVGINAMGEVVVADNHNNFNVTVFTQEGTLLSALESKVKHAQCFDVALTDDGSIVLASKDYRLYIYRYISVPQMGSM